MNHKEEIIFLLRQTGRPGIEDLLEWMDENGFYDSPCSSRYHLAEPGGLAEHSLNVYKHCMAWTSTMHQKREIEVTYNFIDSIAICALLHDLGKAGQYGKPMYIKNTEDSVNPFSANKDLLYVPHEIRSIVIAQKFIDLTEEEQFAILYHNGLYGELNGFKGKEIPLLLILHHADMWAARVTEREDESK